MVRTGRPHTVCVDRTEGGLQGTGWVLLSLSLFPGGFLTDFLKPFLPLRQEFMYSRPGTTSLCNSHGGLELLILLPQPLGYRHTPCMHHTPDFLRNVVDFLYSLCT